jgi:Flp pilus assembly protein CpaB
MQMRRRELLVLVLLAIVAIVAAIVVISIQTASPRAPVLNVAEPVDPLKQEMACVEGVLSNNRLEVNQVQPALDACR